MTIEEFRAALEELGISQADFARFAGIHKNTVSNWAARDSVPPMAEAIIKLLRQKGVVRMERATKLIEEGVAIMKRRAAS